MPDVSMNSNGNGKNGGNGKSAMCSCPACQGGMGAYGRCGWQGHHWGWMILKLILGLFLLGFVFSFGVLVGELKMAVGGYGRSMMMRSYNGNPMGAYPMMGGQGYAMPGATSTPQ